MTTGFSRLPSEVSFWFSDVFFLLWTFIPLIKCVCADFPHLKQWKLAQPANVFVLETKVFPPWKLHYLNDNQVHRHRFNDTIKCTFSDVQIMNFISSILDNLQSKSSKHDDFPFSCLFYSYPLTLKSYQNGTLLTVLHSLFAWNKKKTNTLY